jgi:hypothetical protein
MVAEDVRYQLLVFGNAPLVKDLPGHRQRTIGRRDAPVEGALLRAERPSIASRNTYRTPVAPATQPLLQSLTET